MKSITYQRPGAYEETRFEKIHNVIFENSQQGSLLVAEEIAALIREKQKNNEKCVLGFSTGSSPLKVYEALISMHKKNGLSFKNVIAFNLDEYLPIEKEDHQSYYYYMYEHLFNHVDIRPENIHIPSGTLKKDEMLDYCKAYDAKIEALGGIDFQLLGIGRSGHIGFNEPGSHVNSATRIITLDNLTRSDAALEFMGIENVPKYAITMGVASIKKAKRIVLLAWGDKKSEIIEKAIEGDITSRVPASYLQEHTNITFVLDKEAAALLTRQQTPWLVKTCEWDLPLMRKAIIWLSQKLKKSILKLTDKDYNTNGLSDLLAIFGTSYRFNIKMFNVFQHTITGWPGGKPDADDSQRPERAEPARKRIIIFSPHPDDDVISMGGTFLRLIQQNHEVHVAYQTSGNFAVADQEVSKYITVIKQFLKERKENALPVFNKINKKIEKKQLNKPDKPVVRKLKTLIRRSEALLATRFFGLDDSNVHFLNMPFYESGRRKKKPLAKTDYQLIEKLIKTIKPHQIYAAGDLSDPHGTHKTCLDAIFYVLKKLKNEAFMKDCWLWLYRGAWHEWGVHEIDMAVPLSPDEVAQKRRAIFFHQSQKDMVMFMGEDQRQFWQRAEERNRETASIYNNMGLADYEAIEAFKRFDIIRDTLNN